ncbi:RICIN domain-containing protein [Pseudobacteroides cellulosolvens]|nr:RICIN domain-containing protein [Pseudobacteroides cellulosolvens]
MFIMSVSCIVPSHISWAAVGSLKNGTQFKDTAGNIIHAHGGGLIQYGGYYYWYGEYRDSSNLFLGVRCYRSTDLMNWEYRGEVLKPSSAAELNRCNVERPKVMYNASTKEFVMWMHWENGVHYGEARAAVAYCKTPDGNFTYQGSFRPLANSGVVDHGKNGYMSRDCNVFVDTDGKGYFISSANENMDLMLYELTPDYKNVASLKAKLFAGSQREAPCIIKRNGYYYLITSGCTGWDPNQGKYSYSQNLASGWSALTNFGNNTTYNSQPAFIIPVQGTAGTTYLYTGDRWAGAWGGKVNDSQYVWLPLNFVSDTKLELNYYDTIKIDAAAGTIREDMGNAPCYKLVNENSGKVLDVLDGSTVNAAKIIQNTDSGSESQKWYFVDIDGTYKKIVNVKSGKVLDVNNESKDDGGSVIQYTSTGGANQQWKIVDNGNGYNKIVNKNSSKLLDVNKQSTEDGALVQQWADAGGKNQHWKLVNVQPSSNPTPTPTKVITPTKAPTPTPTNVPSPTNGIKYFKVKGYIRPDFIFDSSMAPKVKAGFKVEIEGLGKSDLTDANGYFEISDVPSTAGCAVVISKVQYMQRKLTGINVQNDTAVSSEAQPIFIWAGDVLVNGNKDNTINMADILEMAKGFNSVAGDGKYRTDCDLNEDSVINMSDVIIVAGHFNKTSSDY